MANPFKKIIIAFLLLVSLAAVTEIGFKIFMKARTSSDNGRAKKQTQVSPIAKENTENKNVSNNYSVSDNKEIRNSEKTGLSPDEAAKSGDASEYDRIANYLNKYCMLLNQKKYKDAYDLLDSTYRKNYYPTLKQFENYAQPIFGKSANGKTIIITYYKKVNNLYLCNIDISEDVMDDQPLNTIEDNCTVYDLGRGKFKLAFNKFISTKSMNLSNKAGALTFKLLAETQKHYMIEYLIKVENKGNTPVQLLEKERKNIFIRDGRRDNEKLYLINNDKDLIKQFTVSPNREVLLILKFMDDGVKPVSLKFENIKVGDKHMDSVFNFGK